MQGRKPSNQKSPTPDATGKGQELSPLPALSQLLHDLNQPLSAINNYAQTGSHLIDNGMTDVVRLKELFGKISQQCGRATLLSQQVGKAAAASADAKQSD